MFTVSSILKPIAEAYTGLNVHLERDSYVMGLGASVALQLIYPMGLRRVYEVINGNTPLVEVELRTHEYLEHGILPTWILSSPSDSEIKLKIISMGCQYLGVGVLPYNDYDSFNRETSEMLIALGIAWNGFNADIALRGLGDTTKRHQQKIGGIIGAMNAKGTIYRCGDKFKVSLPVDPRYPAFSAKCIETIKSMSRYINGI